ncbi:MAG: polyphenol oxidase family protein [bacterium]
MTTPVAGWRLDMDRGVRCYRLDPAPCLQLAFATRLGGVSRAPFDSLNVSTSAGDSAAAVAANTTAIRVALGLKTLVTLRQIHSDTIVEVADREFVADAVEGDALLTTVPGVGLGVKVADCLPVYLWDAGGRGVGLAHSGWRGSASGIALVLARALAARVGVGTRRLRFALGPCICSRCYEVGPEVAERFAPVGVVAVGARPGRFLLNLRAAARHQLAALGLREAPGLELCTSETPTECYSARRDVTTGRNLAVIAITG